jgi:Tol biopolymer transport system component
MQHGPNYMLAPAALLATALPLLGQVPGTTTRVSISSSGTEANGTSVTSSNSPLSLSADGRWVAYNSAATNLVAGDTNGAPDVFLHDLDTGATTRVSVSSSGQQGNADNYGRSSYGASLSADGRFVAKSPNGASQSVSISGDGRWVAFDSNATNIVSNDRNKTQDVFLFDRVTRTTQRLSTGLAGKEANGASHMYFCGRTISTDGRYVAFVSVATNLVSGDTNGFGDIFVRDAWTGTTQRVSVTSFGLQANGGSQMATLSGDGRFVAFLSYAANLAPPGAPPGLAQIYVHDRLLGTTECASVSSTGQPGDRQAFFEPALSADGRYVAFSSSATNLVPGDTNGSFDVFVRDLVLGTTALVSSGLAGAAADGVSNEVVLDASGSVFAFASLAANLVVDDLNSVKDVFVVR